MEGSGYGIPRGSVGSESILLRVQADREVVFDLLGNLFFTKHFIKIGVSATGQINIYVKSFFYLLNTDGKHFSVNTEYLQMLSLRAEVPHFLPDVWSPSINVEETNSQLLCA